MRPYLQLLKFKLSLAVTLSAVLGWFLSEPDSPRQILLLIGGVFLLSGSSAALNQYQERDIDLRMKRTSKRPLPAGQIQPAFALFISTVAGIAGSILLFSIGWIPAIIGLGNLVIYNFAYTPLKRVSSFALIPGGLVGALPPLIGWTAGGGSMTDPVILFVCALMFLWQIPHFWLLIIRFGNEYEEAGFKTIRGYLNPHQIKRLIFFWVGISSLFLLSFPLFNIHLSWWLALIMILANLILVAVFYKLLFRQMTPKQEKLLFILTNVFLIVVLLIFILGSLT